MMSSADSQGGQPNGLFRGLTFVGLLLLFLPAAVHAESFDISGYYKNFGVTLDRPDALQQQDSPDILGMNINKIRLKATWEVSDQFDLHSAYSFAFRIQDPHLYQESVFLAGPNPKGYRGVDFNTRLYPEDRSTVGSFGIFHNLDRLYAGFSLPVADIYIGRQAIAWGTARVINPTDIIAPYTFEELDTEERIGVDALRIRIPIGFMGEIDAGYVFGEDFDFAESAVFLRGKFYVARTDLSLLLVQFRRHLLMGVNMARSVEGAGVWLEAAYVLTSPFEREFLGTTGYDYFRGTAGLDYSFTGKLYGFVEYHYNQAGVASNRDYYFNVLQHPAYEDGAVYLMGQQYIIPGISYQITPLITLNSQILYNVEDRSLFLGPTIEYNISQNIYLGGGLFAGFGPGPERVPGQQPFPLIKSEFGTYPDLFYTNFRVYF